MSNLVRLAVAFGAGALVMYLFDPVTGRRRRAWAQSEVESLSSGASGRIDRLRNAAAATRDDERLRARVRSKVTHLIARPGDVGVDVDNGLVVLSGHVRVSELDGLIDAVAAIAGVDEVQSQLTTRLGPAEASVGDEQPRH